MACVRISTHSAGGEGGVHEAWEEPEGMVAMRTGKAMKGHPDPDLHRPHGKPLKWFVFIWLRVGTFPFLIENCSSGTVSRRVGRKSTWGDMAGTA